MSKAIVAVFAAAVLAAACGTSSPTSVSDPGGRSSDGTLSTQNQLACVAQRISLVYTPVGSRRIVTAEFLDALGNDVFGGDCPALEWSVTPQGAHMQPLFDGSRMVTQAELIVTGPAQTYTVTARSGAMTASLAVSTGR